MDEENENKDSVSLSVTTSADRDLFTRRTCPKCGLDFKIAANESDISWVLNEQIKRQGIDGSISSDEESSKESSEFRCPYCESIFERSKSFTEETINYGKRIIYRDVVLPMIERTFGGLSDSINSSSSRGGLFKVTFTHNRQPKPPRPFHEPEPADMKIVHFLCCDKKAKILENWSSTKFCIYCQTEVAVI